MKFDVNAPQLNQISRQLDEMIRVLRRVEAGLGTVARKQEEAMADLTNLANEVNENNDTVESAVALLEGLSQQLKDAIASDDPAAVQAIVDQLDAQNRRLAEAVVANTPPHPTQLPS